MTGENVWKREGERDKKVDEGKRKPVVWVDEVKKYVVIRRKE